MRYPKHLGERGTIGFVAPSFGCSIEPYRSAFDNAQAIFKEKGHGIVLGPNCYESAGIGISNTPELCAKELTEAYLSGDSNALISCGGGELMCEILPYVDWEAIREAEPKWYMGYSDNTNATFLLATLCDVASIYGPCAAAFGMEPWNPALTHAYELLRGTRNEVHEFPLWEKESLKDAEHPLVPYNCTEPTKLRLYAPKSIGESPAKREGTPTTEPVTMQQVESVNMEGRLLGGCLDCLINLAGTRFDKVSTFVERYKDDGIIWFIEACDLHVISIRRAMWQLKNAGWFRHAKGFLIGRPLANGQEHMGLDQYSAVLEVVKELGVPVVMDANIGHLPPMMPLVCGSYATVKAQGDTISIRMEEK